MYYDDDDNDEGGELEKMTIQIKDVCDEIKSTLDTEFESDKNVSAMDILREEIKGAVLKHEKETNVLNQKLDNLTKLVQYLINKDKDADKSESIASTEETKSTKFDYLPSIYDLKPQLFSPSKTLEERLGKSLGRTGHRGSPIKQNQYIP